MAKMGRKNSKWALHSSLCLLAVLLVACGPAAAPMPAATPAPTAPMPTAAPAPTATPAGEEPRYGGILRVGLKAPIPHFDAHQATGDVGPPIGPSYNYLVQNDPLDDRNIIPDLAESWEVSPDGKVYTFRLHRGVKWHDGLPFTSADVKASFERIIWPPKGQPSPQRGLFSSVERIEAPDDYTISFTLKRYQASFPAFVATPYNYIFPKRILDAKGDMKKDILGTGPFKMKEFIRGVSAYQERNSDYFVKGRPYLDGIMYYVIVDTAANLAALRTHRLDIGRVGGQLATAREREIVKKENPRMVVEVRSINNARFLALNLGRKPWDDVRVRKAVWLVIDRQAFITIAVQGEGFLGGHTRPGSGWEIPQEELLKRPGYRQPKDEDIKEAKRLLAEAGYPKGFRTKLMVLSNIALTPLAPVAKDNLAQIGIDADVDVLYDISVLYDRYYSHNFDITTHAFTFATADPDSIFGTSYVTGGGQNAGQYSNPRLDELFVQQSSTRDPAERKELVRQMLDILDQDYPKVILFWGVNDNIQWPEVKNYRLASTPHMNLKFQDVWLAR